MPVGQHASALRDFTDFTKLCNLRHYKVTRNESVFCNTSDLLTLSVIGCNSPASSLVLTVVPSVSGLRDEQHNVVAGQEVQQARPTPCTSRLRRPGSVSKQGLHACGSRQRQHPGQTRACVAGNISGNGTCETSLWLHSKRITVVFSSYGSM